MLDNYFKNLDSVAKITSILFISLTFFIAKSLTLIIFLTILSLIFFILMKKNVNVYIYAVKSLSLWLIIIWIVYIIFLGIDFKSLIFLYKLILSILLLIGMILTLKFDELHLAIYKILSTLKIFKSLKFDAEKLSYNFTKSIYFLRYIMTSSNKIKKSQYLSGKSKYNFKNYIFPRIVYSFNKINLLEENLNLKFYRLKVKRTNTDSLAFMLGFIVLFAVAIFKEVIF